MTVNKDYKEEMYRKVALSEQLTRLDQIVYIAFSISYFWYREKCIQYNEPDIIISLTELTRLAEKIVMETGEQLEIQPEKVAESVEKLAITSLRVEGTNYRTNLLFVNTSITRLSTGRKLVFYQRLGGMPLLYERSAAECMFRRCDMNEILKMTKKERDAARALIDSYGSVPDDKAADVMALLANKEL